MKCPKGYDQIKRDLSIFSKIDMKAVEAEAVARFNRRGAHSLCHYAVIDNKVCTGCPKIMYTKIL
jgi:hypothetical protein